jgi:antitoxin (DNA-binding transcriptional repressor) of toxin-antitoxin stability system
MYTISATDLARNTRKILDAVASGGETVVVERNHVSIAKIVPPEATMSAAQALEGLQDLLTPRQASAWLFDARKEFDETVFDPWG